VNRSSSAEIGLFAQLACVWEATARKAGNVHPQADFTNLCYIDFLLSAAAIGPVMALAPQRSVGSTVREAIGATQRIVRTNTNLGIVLLLAPLARVPPGEELRPGLRRVLAALDVEDARCVYEAIRAAQPGGLGEASAQDVRQAPTLPLGEIMALAAQRDLVARQYVNDFEEVFEEGLPSLRRSLQAGLSLEETIIIAHLALMARHPDSLIARKRGQAEAVEAGRRAGDVLAADWPRTEASRRGFAALDAWLRAEGHARNPGTSADLVTACLFVALRERIIELPLQERWSARAP
jgi:triphosphoribosyl-dephospho-CoA synthase